VASGPFKWPGSALRWLRNTLKKSSLTQKKTTKNAEFINPIECSDVLVECERLAGVSVNVCGAAEEPEEQVGK